MEQISRSGQRVMARMFSVPFWPPNVWTMAPSGAIVAGVGSDYRFEVHAPDGSVTAVEKATEPVPLQAEEAAWHRQRVLDQMREGQRYSR